MGAVKRLPGVSIRDFKTRLAALPVSVADAIARQAAPLLTGFVQAAYDGGRNVYGDARKLGVTYTWVPGDKTAQTRHRRTGRITGSTTTKRGHHETSPRKLTLVDTGDTRRTMHFEARGRLVRCRLGPRYAKYLIGKYKILPIGDRTSMPAAWTRALDELVQTVQERPNLVAA